MKSKFIKLLLGSLLFVSAVYANAEKPTKEEVAKLYVATFNRAPDITGLNYWAYDSGLSIYNIAKSFFEQSETQTLYPTGTPNTEFITSVYQNLFNRTPDEEGLNYWDDELSNDRISKENFIQAVINGAKNTDVSRDIDILNNKTTVGLNYADEGLSDVDEAKSVMSNITASNTSVDDALADIAKYSTTNVKIGTFIDAAAVKGLNYKTPTRVGTTDAQGHFKYKEGEDVEFSIGNLPLGTATASIYVTPYNIKDDGKDVTTNLSLLLQNFDADRDDENIIDVSKLESYDFNSSGFSSIVDDIKTIIANYLASAEFQNYIDDAKHDFITQEVVKEKMDENLEEHDYTEGRPVVKNTVDTTTLIENDPLKQTLSYPGKYPGMYANANAFAALRNDGSVVTWGDSSYGGDSSGVADKLTDVKAIYSNYKAFAALKNDGSVVTWGDSGSGGDSSDVANKLTDVKAIYSTYGAFAALRGDGSVVTWGNGAGGYSSDVADKLIDIKAIYSNINAFVALKSDSSVVTWGYGDDGGNNSDVANKLTDVKAIYSNENAFAALKGDGSVVTWGESDNGGDSSDVVNKLTNIKAIYSTYKSFAALSNDGSVVTWGDSDWGGNSSDVADKLTDIKAIYSNCLAFAALRGDGSVVTWGYSNYGGDNSDVANKLTDIKAIYSTSYSFAALRGDGSIVTWGGNSAGYSFHETDKITDVKAIYSTAGAFAVLRSDGSVSTWGFSINGGDSSDVAEKLTNVKAIFSTSKAFAALKNDGSVVTWGHSSYGGDSSKVSSQLTDVVSFSPSY